MVFFKMENPFRLKIETSNRSHIWRTPHMGYAGFGSCFHLPGLHFGTGFLSHSHIDTPSDLLHPLYPDNASAAAQSSALADHHGLRLL